MPREALHRQARGSAVQRGRADPGRLAIVARQRLARLLREHAAFGDHGQVEAFGDAGIQLHAVGQRLQRGHRAAEAAVQALRRLACGVQPGLLQRATSSP
jgi:hypothetical protein